MIWIPLITALILPWLANYRRRGSLILAAIACYALILLAVYLHHIGLQQQLAAISGGREFIPPTPESDALIAKIGNDTARRLAPVTALLPAILYPLLVSLIKRRQRKQP